MTDLTLLRACPETATAYAALTNATALHNLSIVMPSRFGKEDAAALARVSQLRELHILSEITNENIYIPLITNPSLTNLTVDARAWNISVTRHR